MEIGEPQVAIVVEPLEDPVDAVARDEIEFAEDPHAEVELSA